jgi:hypothetical protein
MIGNVKPYAKGDSSEVLEFFARMHGPSSFLATPAYLKWMVGDASGIQEDSPWLWFYRSDGRIRAQQIGIRTSAQIERREYSGLVSADLVVSPESQLRGIGAVLSDISRSAAQVTMALEVTEGARRTLTRAGWTDLGDPPLYVRILSARAVMRERGLERAVWAAPAITAISWCWNNALRLAQALRQVRLEAIESFDQRSDALWQDSSRDYEAIFCRDKRFLNWRFLNYPRENYYQCFYVLRRKKTVGYAVLRIDRSSTLTTGYVTDFLCRKRRVCLLLAACTNELRRQGAEAVYCMQTSGALRWRFLLAGFLRRRVGWPIVVSGHGLPGSTRRVVDQRDRWFVTSGDGITDYPREGTVHAS